MTKPKSVEGVQDTDNEKTFAELSAEQKIFEMTELKESDMWTVLLETGARQEHIKRDDIGKALFSLVVARIAFSVHPEG